MSNYTRNSASTITGVNTELSKVAIAVNSKFDRSGGALTGTLDMNENRIINLKNPVSLSDAVNLRTLVATVGAGGFATSGDDYVTLELFDETAGSGGDDTLAFEMACAASVGTGKGIQFLNKTYRLRPKTAAEGNYTFKSFLRGLGDTVVKATISAERIPAGISFTWPRVLPITADNVEISRFVVDGFSSADPSSWATGYDAFTGARGLVLEGCQNTKITNVHTINTMWAGIAHYNCDDSVIELCTTWRCRGNFGDGFYMWGRNGTYINCHTTDVTRIGFVSETNAGSTLITRNIKYTGCTATYGHDSSGLYGGAEGNFGFWFENSVTVTAENCLSNDMLTGGFNTVPSYIAGTEADVADLRYATFILDNCHVKNSRYGVVANCLNEDLWNRTHIIGGSAVNVNTAVYIGTNATFVPQTYVYIKGFDVRLSVHNIATRAVMQLAGNVEIDGMEVIFDEGFDQAAWDAGFDVNGYSTFGAFGTDSGFRFFAKNVRCFKEIAGVKTDIGVRTKFSSTTTYDRLFLELERCNISQETNNVRDLRYRNCRFLSLGSDVVKDDLVFDECTFLARRQTGSTAIVSTRSQNKDVLFRDCLFLFDTPDDYLYLYNQDKLSAAPLIRIKDSRFVRNFETNGRVIRFDATPEFKLANNGVFNVEISGCTFENTGGTTSNPILFSGFEVVDAANVIGYGNNKSTTLTVNTAGNITSTNWSVTSL